jgi:hypothetical protein
MKRLAFALMACAALVFGFGAVAQAQYGSASATFDVPSATPGQPVTITITGCTPGETLTVAVDGVVVGTATCTAGAALSTGSVLGIGLVQQATGSATLTFEAPTTSGTYSVVITGSQGFNFTTEITVTSQATPPATTPASGLPATGADGIGTTTGIAIGLFAVGAALFLVAQVRRRQPSTA